MFGVQNFRDAVESAKRVMAMKKLDVQLAGQSSSPYMSLKMHASAKNKIVKFDEYELLNDQIDRLTEVIDRMNTRPQDQQTQQSRPYEPYIHCGRVRCHRNCLSYDRGYDRGR